MARRIQVVTLVALLNCVFGKPTVSSVLPTSTVPLNNFNFLLTFSEVVQAGTGTVTVQAGTNAANSISCNSASGFSYSSTRGVMAYSKAELASNQQHTVKIPSTCFKSTGGEIMSDNFNTHTFTTITKGSLAETYDVLQPSHLNTLLLTPKHNAWVASTEAFVMYFTEAVQRGDAPITVWQLGSGTGTILDDSPTVTFDSNIPGKVTIQSKTLAAGYGYTLKFGIGAFQDKAENCMKAFGATSGFPSPYEVKVTAVQSLPWSNRFVKYPTSGTTSNVTKYENLVFDFSVPVVASATASLKLCKSWSPTDACATSDAVPSTEMIFLGTKVILNPTADLISSQQYNVSILDTGPFKYFSGLSANELRKWDYSFTVEPSTGADTRKPPLLAAFVDCDGDGDVTDTCLTTTTFTDLTSVVTAQTPMLTTANFMLYFREKVAVAAGKKAVLTTDDGSTSTLAPTVGSGLSDCVVTVDPTLSPGKLYTLTVGPGVLTDLAANKNVYDGTTFNFYTIMETPSSSSPAGSAVAVANTATILITFAEVPRLGLTASNMYLTLQDLAGSSQSISLSNPDRAKFQGTELLIIPETMAVEKSYKVVLPKHSIRYMVSDYSFTFSTRAADTTKPKMVLGSPKTTLAKLSLDKVAPHVWFSESVEKGNAKSIHFKDGSATKYSIISSDTVCGSAGTTADSCVELTTKNKLSMYPLGKSTAGAAAWVTASTTYSIEIEAGAYLDTMNPGANALDVAQFSVVAGGESTGLTLVSSVPSADTTSIDPVLETVALTFNEAIQADDNKFEIKSWHFTGSAPKVTNMAGDTLVSTNGMVVALSFDSVVQAVSGLDPTIHENSGDALFGSTVKHKTAVGSNLLFSPSADPTTYVDKYYVKAESGVVKDTAGTNGVVVDTKTSPASFFVANETSMAIVFTTLDDYSCLPQAKLSDIDIYMNEDIFAVNVTGVQRVKMMQCDSAGQNCVTQKWDRAPVASVTQSATEVKLKRDDTIHFKAILSTSAVAIVPEKGSHNQLQFDAGLFEDRLIPVKTVLYRNLTYNYTTQAYINTSNASETTTTTLTTTTTTTTTGPPGEFYNTFPLQRFNSPAFQVPFRVCSWSYWVPSSKVVHIYSSFSSSSGAKKFQIVIPTSAFKPALNDGRKPASMQSFYLLHDATAPTFDIAEFNPANGVVSAVKENLVLSFSEIIQAGSGSFEIWDMNDNSGAQFKIDVSRILSSSTISHSLISGKKISITPKTLCDGTPACADLTTSTSYYVKTSGNGVVIDQVGNRLAYNKPAWSFGTMNDHPEAPKVEFIGGSKYANSKLTGVIYFSESVQGNAPQKKVELQDCGTASPFTCSATKTTSEVLVFGNGNNYDTGHGLLQFVAPATADRKYKVTVKANTVKGSSTPSVDAGPAADYSYYVATGTSPFIAMENTGGIRHSSDTTGPTVVSNGYDPADGASNIAVDKSIVLWFNEDVAKATGTVSFCTNSDAVAAGSPACTVGRNSLDLPATVEATNFVVDRRKVTINPSSDFKIGQKLYMVMPAGSVRDSKTSGYNAFAKVEAANYKFTVKDSDTVPPHANYVTTTTLLTGHVTIFFSEAVQAVGNGANLIANASDSNTVAVDAPVISGNKVTITAKWSAGTKYKLAEVATNFKDLAQNYAWNNDTNLEFTIASDVVKPTVIVASPASGQTIDPFDVISLQFSDVVLKGSGKISVYSRKSLTDTLLQEIDVSDIQVVNNLLKSSPKKMVSTVSIGVSSKFMCGTKYRLVVPTTAFKDAAGNAFEEYRTSGIYEVTGAEIKDTTKPSLKAVDLGGSSSYSFAGSSLVMYFSEAVQAVSSKTVVLEKSNGGSHCGATAYTTACAFGLSTTISSVEIATLTISGAKVTATVPTLEADKGYKLVLNAGKFKDIAKSAQTQDAVDGAEASGSGPVYVLHKPAAVPADSTGPTISSSYPPLTLDSDVTTMIPPSTTIAITFNEIVQSGTGNINVGVIAVPVSSCTFDDKVMSCKPETSGDSIDLAQNTEYTVSYASTAVKDKENNAADVIDGSTTKLKFSTIDVDYVPPVLTAVSTGTLVSEPYFPMSTATNVAKSTVIALTFNEVVQAGTGELSIGSKTIVSSDCVYDGKTVYGTLTSELTEGKLINVRTSAAGVFKDTGSQPFAHLSSGFTFTTIADDAQAPQVQQRVPQADAYAAVKSDITLYFSEGVQVAGTNVLVKVSDGTTENTGMIPVDNSDLSQGRVTIRGSTVTIDPFKDMGYGKTVTVTVNANAFKDYFGKTSPVFNTKFKTSPFNFFSLLTNNATASASRWSAREGPVTHYSNSTLMLYGGQKASDCGNDLWTSTTGGSWTMVSGATSGPKVAFAPTAADGLGCLLMVGGGCTSTATSSTSSILKTCNNGVSWLPIATTPSVLQFGTIAATAFPSSWSNHAIAMVAGWQLLIVSASSNKGVWRFMDAQMTSVQQILTGSLPFSDRKDPKLLTTSDDKLYLLGGHMCNDAACSNNLVFTDVWSSANIGESWDCQTANYNDALTSVYSKGIGRYVSTVMTHDDTIFLIGGHKPNTTEGLDQILVSSSLLQPPIDSTFEEIYFETVPDDNNYPPYTSGTTFSLYFREAIKAVAGENIRILNYGADNAVDGVTTNADSTVSITTSISHQVLTVNTVSTLVAGRTYGVQVPKLSITDVPGNYLASANAFSFAVSSDTTAPSVNLVSPTGDDISPWTTVTLTMTESVLQGSGSLTLSTESSMPGHVVLLDVAEATIITDKVFFRMPKGQNLTAGARYQYTIPVGMLKDAAGNGNVAATSTFGTVLSGKFTSNSYKGLDVVAVNDIAMSNTSKPTFMSMFPADRATDVPAESGIAILMFFSEPVQFNGSVGIISFLNSTGVVIGTLNLTSDGSMVAKLQKNGIKLTIPNHKFGGGLLLKKAGTFTVSIPKDVIRDSNNTGLDALTKSFTCLAEKDDTTSPVLTMWSPRGTTVGSSTLLDMYFSEDIVAGSGTITVESPLGVSGRMTVAIGDKNVTISGAKLSVSVYSGALNSAGTYSVQIPPGTLKEASHDAKDTMAVFTGLNGTSMQFTTTAADVAAPTLAGQVPPHEVTLTYKLPVSASMRLSFNEAVQAGSGKIELVPKYTSPTITIQASATTQFEKNVFIAPQQLLMPGEVYSVKISTNAFKDAQDNSYVGLTSGYTISTAALVTFQKSTDPSGKRYGSGAIVDDANNIFTLGGHNGTIGADAGSRFNDVWKLITNREINCASGGVKGACSSASACTTGSSGLQKLGSASVTRTVWKAPSVGGKKCVTPGVDGVAKSILGQVVSSMTVDCPCPWCTAAPSGNLSAHMLNNTYVNDYSLVSAAPGAAQERDLLCVKGKVATGPFKCVPDTAFIGKFARPFPRCISAPCTLAPSTTDHSQFASWDTAGSSRNMDCSKVNTSNKMVDGENCRYKCKAGYTSDAGSFVCQEGNLSKSGSALACKPQNCTATLRTDTIPGVECSSGKSMALGSTCALKCSQGYQLSSSLSSVATCTVKLPSAGAETQPEFVLPENAKCVPMTTTAPPAGSTEVITVQGSMSSTAKLDSSFPPEKYCPPGLKGLAAGLNISVTLLEGTCSGWTVPTTRRLETSRRLAITTETLKTAYTITIRPGSGVVVDVDSIKAKLVQLNDPNSDVFKRFASTMKEAVKNELKVDLTVTGVVAPVPAVARVIVTVTTGVPTTTPLASTAAPGESTKITGDMTVKGQFDTAIEAKQYCLPLRASLAKAFNLAAQFRDDPNLLIAECKAWARRLETSRKLAVTSAELKATYTFTIKAGLSDGDKIVTAGDIVAKIADFKNTGSTVYKAFAEAFPLEVKARLKVDVTVSGVEAAAPVVSSPSSNVTGSGPALPVTAEEIGSNMGAIIGGIIGALFGVALIGVCVFCIHKSMNKPQE